MEKINLLSYKSWIERYEKSLSRFVEPNEWAEYMSLGEVEVLSGILSMLMQVKYVKVPLDRSVMESKLQDAFWLALMGIDKANCTRDFEPYGFKDTIKIITDLMKILLSDNGVIKERAVLRYLITFSTIMNFDVNPILTNLKSRIDAMYEKGDIAEA